MSFKLTKRAFTLVELIIVVVIIGILASALLPKLTGAQAKARDSARKADLNQINTALSSYYNDEGQYTGDGCVEDIKTALVPRYINSVPQDPQRNRSMSFSTGGACNKAGSYGILPIYRNGSQNGGVVILANVETDGKSANFVLVQNGNTNIKKFDGTAALPAANCDGASAGNVKCLTPDIEGTTLEPNVCRDGVTSNGSVASAGCDTAGKGSAKVNEAMVYIVTQ